MKLKLLVSVILLIFMLAALGQGQDNASPKNASAPKDQQGTTWDAKLFAILAILALIAFVLIPFVRNLDESHKHLTKVLDSLGIFIDKHADKIDEDKLVQIIHECFQAKPMGAPGLARGMMALTITVTVGMALFFMFAYPPAGEVNTSLREVLLTLTGALTAIVGFYFGGKGSEIKPTEKKPTETIPPKAEVSPEAEEPKPKLYKINEKFEYQNIQYDEKKTMDLANIPDDVLKGLIETKKIEPYFGEIEPDGHKKLAGKPGMYKILKGFNNQDDPYFAGNIMDLKDVPPEFLAVWIANKWIESYSGPSA